MLKKNSRHNGILTLPMHKSSMHDISQLQKQIVMSSYLFDR